MSMPVFLAVVIIVLILFCGEWRISFTVAANVLHNEYNVCMYIFGISIIRLNISYDDFVPSLKYVWIKINDKRMGISLTFDENNKDSIAHYMSNPIAKAVDIKYIRTDALIGAAGFDSESALVVQFMRMALASCVSWLKSMQKLDFAGNVKAVFGKDSLSIYIFGIIGATPANIIYSFIAAYFEKHNRKKVVRRSVKGA